MTRTLAFWYALQAAVSVGKAMYHGLRHKQPNQLSLEVRHKVDFDAHTE